MTQAQLTVLERQRAQKAEADALELAEKKKHMEANKKAATEILLKLSLSLTLSSATSSITISRVK